MKDHGVVRVPANTDVRFRFTTHADIAQRVSISGNSFGGDWTGRGEGNVIRDDSFRTGPDEDIFELHFTHGEQNEKSDWVMEIRHDGGVTFRCEDGTDTDYNDAVVEIMW